MPWRRILGGVLASLLLLSVALPAMCGNCFQGASAESCGEQHGATARHRSDTSMSAKCAACDNEVQAVAATTASTTTDLVNSTNFPAHCPQLAAEPAPLADTRVFASRNDLSSGVLAAALSHNFLARVPVAPHSVATLPNAQPPRTPALALPSVLKI